MGGYLDWVCGWCEVGGLGRWVVGIRILGRWTGYVGWWGVGGWWR